MDKQRRVSLDEIELIKFGNNSLTERFSGANENPGRKDSLGFGTNITRLVLM